MREIKFRAWDKVHNHWIPQQSYCCILIDDGVVMAKHALINVHGEDIELTQFTGLKDKNGVEIYESDDVRYETTKTEGDVIGEMRWSEKQAKFGMRDKGEAVVYGVQAHDVAKRMKVIGNIYENPELLEGKE